MGEPGVLQLIEKRDGIEASRADLRSSFHTASARIVRNQTGSDRVQGQKFKMEQAREALRSVLRVSNRRRRKLTRFATSPFLSQRSCHLVLVPQRLHRFYPQRRVSSSHSLRTSFPRSLSADPLRPCFSFPFLSPILCIQHHDIRIGYHSVSRIRLSPGHLTRYPSIGSQRHLVCVERDSLATLSNETDLFLAFNSHHRRSRHFSSS